MNGSAFLDDIRVLDLTILLPGPFCTQILGDLGADVVKIEPPSGDPARTWPGGLYAAANRNKRSVDLDLKRADHRAVLLDLARDSDVVVENFRPGVVDRLGADYDTLRSAKPDLIYCSVSGYGQTGPLREAPGHDVVYLAAAGALSIPGSWRTAPIRSGLPIADLAGASYAVIAILAALHRRNRYGVGAYLDVALRDVALSFASTRVGADPFDDDSSRSHLTPTNDVFTTADDQRLAIGAVEQSFWEAFRDVAVDVEPQLADPAFDTPASRTANGDRLFALLTSAIRQRTAREWLTVLPPSRHPVQLVVSVPEAAGGEHSRRRQVVDDDSGRVPFPVHCDGEVMGRVRSEPPTLGQHTREVLDVNTADTFLDADPR